jgi:RNA polymerase-binding transcription factor DksA
MCALALDHRKRGVVVMEYEMTPFEKEMEQNLLAMRDNLLAKISKSDNDFRNLVGSAGPGDSVDIASDDLASKKMEAIGRIDAGKLNSINQALVRIRNGKYGVCALCGKKIPEDRLRAIPYALLCMPCKRKSES